MSRYTKFFAAAVGALAIWLNQKYGTSDDLTTALLGVMTALGVYGVPNTKPAQEAWTAPPGFAEWVRDLEAKGAPKLPENFASWLEWVERESQ